MAPQILNELQQGRHDMMAVSQSCAEHVFFSFNKTLINCMEYWKIIAYILIYPDAQIIYWTNHLLRNFILHLR